MSKGGSKVLTGIIAFLIGFIFAIVVEVSAIVGAYFYISTADLNAIFEALKIPNKDSDGNYIYINTDKENGGVQNLKELFGVLYGYIFSEGATQPDYPILGENFAAIEKLLPISGSLVDQLENMVGPYMDIDWEEFKQTNFTDLPQYLSDCAMNIRPAKTLSALADKGVIGSVDGLIGDDANILVRSLLAGTETDYAYTSSGLALPVFYDMYTLNDDGNFYRAVAVDDTEVAPGNLGDEYFDKTDTTNADGEALYKLYYVPCALSGSIGEAAIAEGFEGNYSFDADGKRVQERVFADGTSYIAVMRNAEGDFVLPDDVITHSSAYAYRKDYAESYMALTGNYFVRADGTEVQVNPVTIQSLSSDPFEPLDNVLLTEFVGDQKITNDVFGSATVGDLMEGNVNFDERVQNIHLSAVVEDIQPDNKTMMYIVYNVTDVYEDDDGFHGTYDKDGANIAVDLVLGEGGFVTGVADGQGNLLEGNTVGDISSVADDLQITVFLDAEADDAIMSYLGYGITDLHAQKGTTAYGDRYDYTGRTQDDEECFVTVRNGIISSVWYYEDGAKVAVQPTTVNDISDRLSGITDDLTIGSVMDVPADDAIMMYMSYGLTDVRKVSDGVYTGTCDGQTCTIQTSVNDQGKDIVTAAYYTDEATGKTVYLGTAIGQVPDRVGSLPDELSASAIVDISTDSIMAYIGYGITNIQKADSAEYDYTGVYNGETCYIIAETNADGREVISEVWTVKDGQKVYVKGETLSGMTDNVESITQNLTVGEIIEVNEDSSEILKQLQHTAIADLGTELKTLTIQTVYSDKIYGVTDPFAVTYPEYNKEYLYYILTEEGDYKLVNGNGKLTIEQLEAWQADDSITYYTYGRAQGMWRMILYVGGNEKAYTFDELNDIVRMAAQNVKNATIRDLVEVGILSEISEDKLNGNLYINGTPVADEQGKVLVFGDIQLQYLIDIIIKLVG